MKSLILLRCVPLLACLMIPVAEAHAVLVEGTDPTELDYNVEIIKGEGDLPDAISLTRFSGGTESLAPPTGNGVPEPSTFLLAASAAAAGLFAAARRRGAGS